MRTINFFAPIHQDSCNGLIDEIANTRDDILIKFSSRGGDIDTAFYMYRYIRSLNRKVVIQNVGDVASSAIVLFLAANTRISCSHGLFQVHGLSCTLTGQATLKTLANRSRSLQHDIERYNSIWVQRTGSAKAQIDILDTLRGGDEIILNAQNANSAGLISNICDS